MSDPVALISVVGGLLVAAISVSLTHVYDRRRERLQATARRGDLMARYRDPLLWAAFDLQSRLYNIVAGLIREEAGAGTGFVHRFVRVGTDWQRDYARTHTVFLLAEYLCWTEVLRRHIGFLDLGRTALNRRVMQQLWVVGKALSTDAPAMRGRFAVLRGEQRAIGELMIESAEPGTGAACLGYAAFRRRLQSDDDLAAHTRALLTDMDSLGTASLADCARLVALQHALLDLLDLLDPGAVKFPVALRHRLAVPGGLSPLPGGPDRDWGR